MSGLEGEAQDSGFLPTIVPIGGFHGAGKTSLIVAAARLLKGRGLRLAAVLNDQGAELLGEAAAKANAASARA
jgi:molybdopterin-guanine dinucleotide biosynthesis protein